MSKINRRQFFKTVSLGTLAAASGVPFLSAATGDTVDHPGSNEYPQEEIPLPTKAQIKWQEAERVAVFHYDLHVFDGEQYVQARNRITPSRITISLIPNNWIPTSGFVRSKRPVLRSLY